MIDGQENTRHDSKSREGVKTPGQLIPEKHARAESRDDRLNIENDVNDGRVAVFEREGEENSADGRARKAGKDQVTPRPRFDFRNLRKPRDENEQEHQQNQ